MIICLKDTNEKIRLFLQVFLYDVGIITDKLLIETIEDNGGMDDEIYYIFQDEVTDEGRFEHIEYIEFPSIHKYSLDNIKKMIELIPDKKMSKVFLSRFDTKLKFSNKIEGVCKERVMFTNSTVTQCALSLIDYLNLIKCCDMSKTKDLVLSYNPNDIGSGKVYRYYPVYDSENIATAFGSYLSGLINNEITMYTEISPLKYEEQSMDLICSLLELDMGFETYRTLVKHLWDMVIAKLDCQFIHNISPTKIFMSVYGILMLYAMKKDHGPVMHLVADEGLLPDFFHKYIKPYLDSYIMEKVLQKRAICFIDPNGKTVEVYRDAKISVSSLYSRDSFLSPKENEALWSISFRILPATIDTLLNRSE